MEEQKNNEILTKVINDKITMVQTWINKVKKENEKGSVVNDSNNSSNCIKSDNCI